MYGTLPASDGDTLTLDKLMATIRALTPWPRRWMVRRAGLSAAQSSWLNALALPRRGDDSEYLPAGCLAIVFEEDGRLQFPACFSKLYIIRDEDFPETAGVA